MRVISQRNAAITKAVNPLPGAQPYQQILEIRVRGQWDKTPILDFLVRRFPGRDAQFWQTRLVSGAIVDRQGSPVAQDRIVRGGERYFHRAAYGGEPIVNGAVRVVYEDECLLVLHKPAPLPVHPCGRFNRNTLTHILDCVYGKAETKLVHRLDAATSGLMVVARSSEVAKLFHSQFLSREVEKTYLARVRGHPTWDFYNCRLPISRRPSVQGSRSLDQLGLQALTEFSIHSRLDDGTSVVRAVLRTGRTNQIRLHLSLLGFPIIGDTLYSDAELQERTAGEIQFSWGTTEALELLAYRLKFWHPFLSCQMEFQDALPEHWRTLGIVP